MIDFFVLINTWYLVLIVVCSFTLPLERKELQKQPSVDISRFHSSTNRVGTSGLLAW